MERIVLGCEARDVITGFEGIVTGLCQYLYGCSQWGITPKAKDGECKATTWFDEGRVRYVGSGVNAADVRVADNGPGDSPTIGHGRR